MAVHSFRRALCQGFQLFGNPFKKVTVISPDGAFQFHLVTDDIELFSSLHLSDCHNKGIQGIADPTHKGLDIHDHCACGHDCIVTEMRR